MGAALYAHPQWSRLAEIWESYYPLSGLNATKRHILTSIEAAIPDFVALLVNHRPAHLHGKTLGSVITSPDRLPGNLRNLYRTWKTNPRLMRRAPPSLAFAVVGQARADGTLTPEVESRMLTDLLTYWAMKSALRANEICAQGALPPSAIAV
jgi:hypothetical protein